jgi:hypothetical protein
VWIKDHRLQRCPHPGIFVPWCGYLGIEAVLKLQDCSSEAEERTLPSEEGSVSDGRGNGFRLIHTTYSLQDTGKLLHRAEEWLMLLKTMYSKEIRLCLGRSKFRRVLRISGRGYRASIGINSRRSSSKGEWRLTARWEEHSSRYRLHSRKNPDGRDRDSVRAKTVPPGRSKDPKAGKNFLQVVQRFSIPHIYEVRNPLRSGNISY